MHTITKLAVVSAFSLLVGCGKKEAEPASGAAAKPTEAVAAAPSKAPDPAPAAEPAAAPAATAWLKLAPLNVQLEVADGKAKDQSEGLLKQVGIEAGTAMFSVGIVPADMKLTFDQVVTAGSSGGTKVTVKEKLADGFHVEAATEGGSIQIDVRRVIGGVEYSCGTLAPDADTAKIVRTACLTLKAS